ncbi:MULTISPECIES: restriction endonuclease subunit S [Moraxella]|uniref:restriction endonuclease subunit S n=1 Tax=Moraxella TaxID=475 RepID=UPI0008A351A9|nr:MULTISPECIES: restriction endonuclease subunit S [Moraxella]OFN28007.1 restriction endonuclease subunit S [Moraxella sp. HMSC061H09]RKL85823.1 restriction endonuclease subunit S [Moraxella catarrhalis]RKM42921.1 restriction endonuclease subunit S [Moraxella catarrhalis]
MHPFLQQLLQGQAVEWKTLGEVANLNRGRVMSKTYLADNIGEYPVYSSQTANNGEIGKINTFDFEGEFITWTTDGANAGTVFYRNEKFSITNVCGLITLKYDYLTYKFLFYWLSIQAKKHVYSGMGNPKLMSNQMEKIQIPIPPLSVQSQIVQILDTFTELTEQLTAELSMRQKQYHYYRDLLLSEHELAKVGFEWKRLGEVAKIKHGKDWKKLAIGDIPVYGSGGIMGYVDTFSYDKPSVLIPRKGSITNLFYVETPFWNVDTIYYTQIDTSQILPKFLYYFIKTIDLMQLDTGSGRPSLTQAILNKIQIPIPPLSIQSQIVQILDTFDALTQSISDGLPKEIQLRQKQYEYYRELLLGFPMI